MAKVNPGGSIEQEKSNDKKSEAQRLQEGSLTFMVGGRGLLEQEHSV